MIAYYNEIDPYAAQWLRNLIAAGHIAPGEVDERSMSRPTTCAALLSATSSRGLEGGVTPYASPAGTTLDLFGPDPVLASPSAQQGKERAQKTHGTCGLSSTASSRSAALQWRLESRLRHALDVNGSPEYALTWKTWAMRSGPPICALRASGRRTSDSGCGGWPTPNANPAGDDYASWKARHDRQEKRSTGGALGMPLGVVAHLAVWPTPTRQDSASSGAAGYSTESGRHPGTTLTDAARFAGWPTARQTDGSKSVRTDQGALNEVARKGGPQDLDCAAHLTGWPTPDASAMNTGCDWPTHAARIAKLKAKGINGNGAGLTLGAAASAAGWATPASRDWKSESATDEFNDSRDAHPRGKPLSYQATLGASTSGLNAQTAKRGALNPQLSRWLMGYPGAWDGCAGTATPSSRK